MILAAAGGWGYAAIVLVKGAGDKKAYPGAKAHHICGPMKLKAEALGYLEAERLDTQERAA